MQAMLLIWALTSSAGLQTTLGYYKDWSDCENTRAYYQERNGDDYFCIRLYIPANTFFER